MKEQNYFITGGCGFVGRNTAKRLLKKECSVWVVDNLFTGRMPEEWLDPGYKKIHYKKGILLYKRNNSKLYFIKGDLIQILYNELKTSNNAILPKFKDVFHFASIVVGRSIIEGDPLLISRDLAIDSTFFLWLSRNQKHIKRVLYASSSAAYPTSFQESKTSVSLKESFINFNAKRMGIPDLTYGWSKLTGEYLAKFASSKYNISVACVRPFSGYGEDQEITYPIPAIALRVAKKENPLEVWGNGEQGRDFVYIEDCIDAFFVALKNITDGTAVNIGSGKLTTFNDVLSIFCKLKGYSPDIKHLLNKPTGVAERYADTEKISKMGWYPKVNINEGFGRVLKYAEKNRK
jgi:UDP-glucose 4-epimerase